MRSLVENMVGVVGLCVCGVVSIVGVYGLEGVECVFVWRAMIDSGECCCCCGLRVRVGLGDMGERGEKKLYYLVAPFEIADFRGE